MREGCRWNALSLKSRRQFAGDGRDELEDEAMCYDAQKDKD